jgi:thiol:disulfide interchange protein DsbC
MTRYFLVFALAALTTLAHADDRSQLKATIEKRLNSAGDSEERFKLESVQSTPIPGIYELLTEDRKVLYSDGTGKYVFTGHLIDTDSMKDLTSARLDDINKFTFDELPFELAIKEVRGTGARRMAIFSDTDCPFCRRLENDIKSVTNVTIYTFLYPIAALHPKAHEHSKKIWCAKDRLAAWRNYWAKNLVPDSPNCDASAIEKIQALGQKHGVNGTPTLVFANGKMVPGAISGAEVEKNLDQR